MFGYLKIFVLKELEKSSRSGYELMHGFEKISGNKPSPGTIYPLLGDLKAKGLIRVSQKGKGKFYSITRKGDSLLKKLTDERKKALKKIIPLLGSVYNKDELDNMKDHFNPVPKVRMHKDFDVVVKLRNEIFSFAESKSYAKNRSKFRTIISAASKSIRRLR